MSAVRFRIEKARSFPGAPPDNQILSMMHLQDEIARAFLEVRPDDELMQTCHEALVLAGLKADK